MEPDPTPTQTTGSTALPRDSPPQILSGTEASTAFVLGQFGEKLSNIERALAAKSPPAPKSAAFLEFLKILFGGWPALALVFMILFRAPLGQVLRAVVEKTQGADEIGAWGLSLKSTLRAEATRAGFQNLVDTLPSLSPPAIERLLHSGREYNTLLSTSTSTAGNKIERIYFADDGVLEQLA